MDIQKVLKILLPKEWLDYFEVINIEEKQEEWHITLYEKEDRIPKGLVGKNVVKDGFMNSIEIHDFPLRGKPTYLRFHRRKWKVAGEDESHFNNYEFHPQGMKATKEFGSF